MFKKFTIKTMGKSKDLDMSAVTEDKQAHLQKLAIFKNRVERKKAFVHAIDDAIKEGKKYAEAETTSSFDRARTWVWIFEMQEKASAQRQLLSQHIAYLNTLTDEQNL